MLLFQRHSTEFVWCEQLLHLPAWSDIDYHTVQHCSTTFAWCTLPCPCSIWWFSFLSNSFRLPSRLLSPRSSMLPMYAPEYSLVVSKSWSTSIVVVWAGATLSALCHLRQSYYFQTLVLPQLSYARYWWVKFPRTGRKCFASFHWAKKVNLVWLYGMESLLILPAAAAGGSIFSFNNCWNC